MRARSLTVVLVLITSFLTPTMNQAVAVSTYPSAPQNVTQSAIAAGVRMTWTAPADVATGITGYKIEKSTDGSTGWTEVGSVSSSTLSYDILNLAQSAVYVRVAATASAGRGAYGYKWTKIYGTTSMKNGASDTSFPYESGYGIAAGDTSTTIGSPSFTRIRYLVNTTISSVNDSADMDFYKWVTTPTSEARSGTPSPTIANLQIPIPLTGTSGFTVQANVQDLSYYSTHSRVGSNFGKVGRLELWGWNYDYFLSGLTPTGNNGNYDFDDTPAANGTYGSFQIHNASDAQTVFAWNRHDNATAYSEVGYGNNPTTTGNLDWTFCGQGGTYGSCSTPSSFRLQIFINSSVTPLVGTSTSTISIPATGVKRTALTLSATSSLAGFFTFYWSGKKISGCAKKATAASAPFTATCSWKPSVPGLQTITATFSNAAAGYSSSSAMAQTVIARRTGSR